MDYTKNWKELQDASGKPGWRERARHAALSFLALSSKPEPFHSLRLVYLHNVFADQVSQFERQIKYLMSIGSFLPARDVCAIIRSDKPLDKRYFHLSFDDGFRNVVMNALPVLREHNVPATFFVPTSLISADFKAATEYARTAAYFPRVLEMATWDDLGAAQEHGLEIASHTRSHARLSDISGSTAKMEDEIFGSKEDIERELGRSCSYISWPFGKVSDANTTSLEFVKKAGYEACFGAYRGKVVPRQTDLFSIPRHHFEAHWPLSHLKYFAHGAREN